MNDTQGITMPKPQAATNPFYLMLVVAGVLFVITAFAYLTMAVREADGTAATAHGLLALVARHGLTVLIAELLLLAVATFGAIGTDDYWTRRAAERSGTNADSLEPTETTIPTNDQ